MHFKGINANLSKKCPHGACSCFWPPRMSHEDYQNQVDTFFGNKSGRRDQSGCVRRAHKVLQWNLTDFHYRAVENRQQNSILKLLRFSGWRRLRSFNTVTLCVSSFEGPQELTPRESKSQSEEKKKKKRLKIRSHKAGSSYPKTKKRPVLKEA